MFLRILRANCNFKNYVIGKIIVQSFRYFFPPFSFSTKNWVWLNLHIFLYLTTMNADDDVRCKPCTQTLPLRPNTCYQKLPIFSCCMVCLCLIGLSVDLFSPKMSLRTLKCTFSTSKWKLDFLKVWKQKYSHLKWPQNAAVLVQLCSNTFETFS